MTPRRSRQLNDMLTRYGLVSMSSAFVSVAHFAVQLVAIARLPADGIGLLAFAIVLLQLGFGVSNALVCAPFSILIHRTDGVAQGQLCALTGANGILLLAYGALAGTILAVGASPAVGLAFGVAIAASLLRWFGRNHAFATERPMRAAWSDLLYAGMLGLLAGGVLLARGDLLAIAAAFVVASIVGLAPFLPVWPELVGAPSFAGYRAVWRDQARWALVGVLTTEATANSHAYLVTATLGPGAFAPLSVAALFLRPLNVCITALMQTERPRMARDLEKGDIVAADRSRRQFTGILVILWAGTVALAALILKVAPQLVLRSGLDATMVEVAIWLTAAIALLQCMMTPRSVLLQAADQFRTLATASMIACGISIAGVVALLFLLPAAWSLLGIAAGQGVMLWGVYAAERRWRCHNDMTIKDDVR